MSRITTTIDRIEQRVESGELSQNRFTAGVCLGSAALGAGIGIAAYKGAIVAGEYTVDHPIITTAVIAGVGLAAMGLVSRRQSNRNQTPQT